MIIQIVDASNDITTHNATTSAMLCVMKRKGDQLSAVGCTIAAMRRLEIVTGKNSTRRRLINSRSRNKVAITIQNTGVISQRAKAADKGLFGSPVMLN